MTTLTNLLFCIGLGTGAVTLTLSSVFYGDRDRASLLEVLREMTAFSLMLMGAAVLLTGVFAPGMAGLFVREDPETASIAVSGLRMLVLSLLPAILANGFRSYAQGIGRPGMAALIAVMRFLVPTVLLAFGFGRLFGLKGVWMGTVCGEGLTLLAIAAAAWHRHGRIAFSAGAFSFLDRDFGVSGENRLENAVKTTAEAAETSRRLYTFCLGKGLDRRTAMLIGLCAEEIAVNVITHGFSKDRRAHSVDLRLTLEGDRKVLRIRDDCANFDPVRYLELHRDEDPAAHIGLRMVMGMVKEADYVRSLGLNQLTLVL